MAADRGAEWRPRLGAWPTEGGVRIRVWAPTAAHVDVVIDSGLRVPLDAQADGHFAGNVPGLGAGGRYRVAIDGGKPMPDPASRWQPDGVHGRSVVVDPHAFRWTMGEWQECSVDELVIYELHVGTFTPEGTFAAAAERLAWLADLGVSAVELMPVAAFPGARNWGYDGAALFAPAACYGTPDDLRRFVDEAHRLHLAVLLDVVYNHFGPDGAYAAAASPRFFSERHRSPWGAGINLDGPDAAGARGFFIENALHWLVEYRMDGLRLDATHAMVDDSPRHFLAELTATVRETIAGRTVHLIAEDHRNLRTIVDPPGNGGWGLDAVWADDLHHVVRRLTAGDDEGYFVDFAGTTKELAKTIAEGWLYQGATAPHFGGPRGTDPAGLPFHAFVVCIQNHDQVGNRALGDRLHHAIDRAMYRAISLLFLMLPETPLLFMGQEWAAGTPFQYFTDHTEPLGQDVRDGRRAEFGHFRGFSDPAARATIPDPQAVSTFEASRLRWEELTEAPHAGVLTLYRDGLRLRQTLAPAGRSGSLGPDRVIALGEAGIALRRARSAGGDLLTIASLTGPGSFEVTDPAGGEWRVCLSTEDARVADDPKPVRVVRGSGQVIVHFERPGTVVLEEDAGAKESGHGR